MDDEQLLAEVEDLLRTMPPRASIRHPTDENFAWLGRASAVIEKWDVLKTPPFNHYARQLTGTKGMAGDEGFSGVTVMLHQARCDLRLRTLGSVNIAVGHGMVFDYFDEVRKIIEPARQDVFFIDPYLDADFVSRYLPHVSQGVTIRLLTRERLSTLMPAVRAFVRQTTLVVEVRSAPNFHDRYVFTDRTACFQSGASFKDGGRTAPTTLTQITDAFPAMQQTYEGLWSSGTVQS